MRCQLLVAALVVGAMSEGLVAPVLVTGATGGTGSLIYNLLKHKGVPVRGLVRNITKARTLLGCEQCNKAEGIFVGDVRNQSTLLEPVQDASALVIAVGPSCSGPYPSHCVFPPGAYPVDVDWHGGKNQIAAFARANPRKPVLLISTMETTDPTFVGMTQTLQFIHFYKLNLEAHLMGSGVPFTIFKPCMFKREQADLDGLMVGHDDTITSDANVTELSRTELARLVVAAVIRPAVADGLRFDVCSRSNEHPTPDSQLDAVLEAAAYRW